MRMRGKAYVHKNYSISGNPDVSSFSQPRAKRDTSPRGAHSKNNCMQTSAHTFCSSVNWSGDISTGKLSGVMSSSKCLAESAIHNILHYDSVCNTRLMYVCVCVCVCVYIYIYIYIYKTEHLATRQCTQYAFNEFEKQIIVEMLIDAWPFRISTHTHTSQTVRDRKPPTWLHGV